MITPIAFCRRPNPPGALWAPRERDLSIGGALTFLDRFMSHRIGSSAHKKTRLRDLTRAGAQGNTQKRFGRFRRGMAGAGCSWCLCPKAQTVSPALTKRRRLRMSGPVVRRLRPWISYQTRLFLAAGLSQETTILISRQATSVHFQRCVPYLMRRDRNRFAQIRRQNAELTRASFWRERDGAAERVLCRTKFFSDAWEEPPSRAER